MPKSRNDLRAGLFLLVSAAAICTLALLIRGSSLFTVPTDRRIVRFELSDDVGGLRVGDDVRIGGFKVGDVRSITIEPPDKPGEQPYISVVYAIPHVYPVRKDAVLRIQKALVGSSSLLNFESLGSGTPLALDDASFRGQRAVTDEFLEDFADMRTPLKQILADVRDKTLPSLDASLANTRDITANVKTHVEGLFTAYHSVMDHAVVMVDKISDFFGSTTTDFRGFVANINKVFASFHEKLPGILDKVDAVLVKLDQSVQSAQEALNDIKATVANTREMTAAGKDVIVGNRGKLDAMIASLKTASDNLKGATAEIRRSPWRLLYKPAAGEMGNLNLFDATREFADGASHLDDAATALRDALHESNPDPQQIKQLMDKLDKSFEEFGKVEKTLWDQVQE